MKKNRTLCLLAGLFALGFPLTGAGAPAQVAGKSVKIGIMLPMTGTSGTDSKAQVMAAEIARDEINEAGGIGGVPLEFVVYDTRTDVKENISIFKKLALSDKVLAVLGPGYSTECEVVFPLANQLKLVAVAPASAKPGLTAAHRPWAFRDSGIADRKLEPAVRKWVEMYKVKRIYMIYDAKDAMAKAEASFVFPAFLKKNGVETIGTSTYMMGDMDFSAQVTKVKEANPEGIVISGGPTEMANFIREARKQGLKQPVLGGVQAYQVDLLRLGGKEVEGLVTGGHTWVDRPDPRLQAFVKKYKERGRKQLPELEGGDPDCNQISIYDAVYVTKMAMEDYKITNRPEDLEKDREKVRLGWQNLKNYNATQAVISMGADGDTIGKSYVIQVKNGRFTAIE